MYVHNILMHSNSFSVHIVWLISVLSLMPKGEIVGIKSVLPSVTTLSNIISLLSSSLV